MFVATVFILLTAPATVLICVKFAFPPVVPVASVPMFVITPEPFKLLMSDILSWTFVTFVRLVFTLVTAVISFPTLFTLAIFVATNEILLSLTVIVLPILLPWM